MKIKLHFYMLGLCALFALEAGAADGTEVLSRLSLAHMHYFKSCFALERGDEAMARDELRLARVLDEDSLYLRLAMQRRKTSPSFSPERFRGELSKASADGHARVAHADPITE